MDNEKDLFNPSQITGNSIDSNQQNTGYTSQSNGYTAQNNSYMPNNINSIIDSLSGWMKFIGIYTIISGALTCLGIITAAIGVPLILAGIALVNGSKSLKIYNQQNNQYSLNEVFTYINKYFKTQGILVIVGIVLTLIYIVIIILFAALSINGILHHF